MSCPSHSRILKPGCRTFHSTVGLGCIDLQHPKTLLHAPLSTRKPGSGSCSTPELCSSLHERQNLPSAPASTPKLCSMPPRTPKPGSESPCSTRKPGSKCPYSTPELDCSAPAPRACPRSTPRPCPVPAVPHRCCRPQTPAPPSPRSPRTAFPALHRARLPASPSAGAGLC